MVRFGPLSFVLILVFASILSAPVLGQTGDDAGSATTKVRPVPPAVTPMPFSTGASRTTPAPSIQFRPADQISESDRLLAANDESSIAEHAEANGFNLDQGRWSYEEIVCPALPNHLFLRYTQNNGDRDVTVFSASIPRSGEGRIRIIPIQKRSYSLFSPAPINALTISAFNHIRAEEDTERSSNWLGNGLCYAALAGANPKVALITEDAPQPGKHAAAMTAILEVPAKGGEVIKFVDTSATPRPMEWTMTFTPKGKLVKATHAPASLSSSSPVPATSGITATKAVPQ